MATYAIGDVQGCWETLQRLLARVGFDPGTDRLLFCGDLVNRGPASLEVLRFAAGHAACVDSVLGNHDLHLLSLARGLRTPGRGDTLDALLAAPDRDDLLDWLRARPFVLRVHGAAPIHIVHAGLLPAWSADDALALGAECHAALVSADGDRLLSALREPRPPRWSADLHGWTRLALAVSVLTRLRVCDTDGAPRLDFKGPPHEAPTGCRPWFDAPGRRSADDQLVFGHWAALGFHRRPGLLGLDTGCVWGGQLTACRLEDRAVFHEPCADAIPPRGQRA